MPIWSVSSGFTTLHHFTHQSINLRASTSKFTSKWRKPVRNFQNFLLSYSFIKSIQLISMLPFLVSISEQNCPLSFNVTHTSGNFYLFPPLLFMFFNLFLSLPSTCQKFTYLNNSLHTHKHTHTRSSNPMHLSNISVLIFLANEKKKKSLSPPLIFGWRVEPLLHALCPW